MLSPNLLQTFFAASLPISGSCGSSGAKKLGFSWLFRNILWKFALIRKILIFGTLEVRYLGTRASFLNSVKIPHEARSYMPKRKIDIKKTGPPPAPFKGPFTSISRFYLRAQQAIWQAYPRNVDKRWNFQECAHGDQSFHALAWYDIDFNILLPWLSTLDFRTGSFFLNSQR